MGHPEQKWAGSWLLGRLLALGSCLSIELKGGCWLGVGRTAKNRPPLSLFMLVPLIPGHRGPGMGGDTLYKTEVLGTESSEGLADNLRIALDPTMLVAGIPPSWPYMERPLMTNALLLGSL